MSKTFLAAIHAQNKALKMGKERGKTLLRSRTKHHTNTSWGTR